MKYTQQGLGDHSGLLSLLVQSLDPEFACLALLTVRTDLSYLLVRGITTDGA
jgi:hypothetical protein